MMSILMQDAEDLLVEQLGNTWQPQAIADKLFYVDDALIISSDNTDAQAYMCCVQKPGT